ncbi:MAG: Rne/Rng family ribonuclease [Coriobacteriia bacterium]|nr:Rne/Rng family ribonuclease [Coriobacteriia bacterium]
MAEIVREMLISHDSSETRVGVLEDGKLSEFYIERAKRSVVGNVYLARVRDVLPGMQAAFVDIGLEKNAFLYVDEVVSETIDGVEGVPRRDIQALLKPGQQVMVQVLKDPMGTKGARVTTDVTLPGRFLVLMPFSEFIGISRKLPDDERERLHGVIEANAQKGTGLIVRTAAAGASEKDLLSDLEFLSRLWKRVQHQATEALPPEVIYTEMDLALRFVRDVFSEDYRRLLIDDKVTFDKVVSFLKKTSPNLVRRVQLYRERVTLFDYFGINEQIDAVLERAVRLPSGGYIAIDQTEALTAVDVNTGSFTGRKNLEDTILRTNLEAADEVVRQLRLRDIGGIIVIDFIDMEDAFHRAELFRRLNEALERDRTKTRVMEISRLGLVEMTRKNVTDGLYNVLTDPCPTCKGQGRVLSEATRRIMVERRMREILLAGKSAAYLFGINPETYAIVNQPGRNVVASLRAETRRQVAIVADPDCGAAEVRTLIEGKAGSIEKAMR